MDTKPKFYPNIDYVKKAWRGQVWPEWLLMASIITETILCLAFRIHNLALPAICILVLFLVWSIVALWRCAFYGNWKWFGYLVRMFVTLQCVGIIFVIPVMIFFFTHPDFIL